MKLGLKKITSIFLLLTAFTVFYSCSTTKKKQDVKGLKKLYHNTTAKFNGYFNAEELLDESIVALQDMHIDNYNKLLPVYDYIEIDNPQSIKDDMDKAIEKVSVVATVHDVSNYVDDCYLLIGKAQYLKQDYIAAEETFQYFEEIFDPKNPYGRAYDSSSRSSSGRKSKKEIQKQRKEAQKEREEARKEKEKEREEIQKERLEERKAKEKERKEIQKQRDKEKKERARSKKKNSRSSRSRSGRSSSRTRTSERGSTKRDKEETPSNTDEQKSGDESNTTVTLSKEEQEAMEAAREELAKEKDEEDKRRKKLEAEKEKQKEKEEEKYKNQGEGAIFKNKSAYTEGLYWLARTYIETERFGSAEYVLKQLEDTPGLKDKVANKIPAAWAHLHLKTKQYNDALEALELAIELEKKRNLKARYAFIRAQLYETLRANKEAYAEYSRAKKFSTEYELDFNANLNELKLGYREGSISAKRAMNKLDKMLEERKNQDYQDQIYFTRAQLMLDGGDIDEAIDEFELAIGSSGSNPNVKLEAYFRLAELLFDNGLYKESKSNYDEVLKMMSKTDDRYKSVQRLSENLSDISKNIETVELQDSLLALSKLSESELREIATKIVEESIAAGDGAEDSKADTRKSNIISSNRQLGAGRSNFFAYNPIALNQGKVEFKRTWGERLLEDNWRRSLRSDAGLTAEDIVGEVEEEKPEVSEDQIREVLRDIPRNQTQIASSEKRIQNALFQLGILFRDRIRNYNKSVEVLTRLVNEFPEYEKRDEALFYLYLSQLDLEKETASRATLATLRQDYPDSKFTKLATDPEYANRLRDEEDSIEKYYERAYTIFENADYQTVLDMIEKKDDLYGRNKTYAPKFALLNAMSLGSIKGKQDYVTALQQLIRSYPQTPEETRAKEILRFLKGDAQAFDEILYDEALESFEDAPDKLHYVFVVTYGLDQKTFDNTKVEILNYNKKFHRFDNLKISNIYLNQENKARIILIRSFDNKEKSLKYYEGVSKNKELFIKDQNIGYDIFAVTQKNYREVIKQKGIANYRVFFDQKYLSEID